MRSKIAIILLFLLGLAVLLADTGKISIITHPANNTVSLTRDDLRKIFTGRKKTWPDGNRIMIVLLKRGEQHDQFLKEVVRMNSTQFSITWKKLIFTGKAPLLTYARSTDEMIKLVAENPNAVGYIQKDHETEKRVKSLFIRE